MTKNEALIDVLIERFVKLRLPRILDIKEKLSQGESLNSMDIGFFKEIFSDIKQNYHLIEGNKELQELMARAIHLDKEITEMALINERKNQS
ncbi:MAG: hypothetical protein QM479_03705 [Pseudomonadota bacterium]